MSINISAAGQGDSSLLVDATRAVVGALHFPLVSDKGLPMKIITYPMFVDMFRGINHKLHCT